MDCGCVAGQAGQRAARGACFGYEITPLACRLYQLCGSGAQKINRMSISYPPRSDRVRIGATAAEPPRIAWPVPGLPPSLGRVAMPAIAPLEPKTRRSAVILGAETRNSHASRL
jgi:hypothetical protein